MDTVQATTDAAVRIGLDLHKHDKPALVLTNLLQMGAIAPDARKRVVELAKGIRYDKMAMVGKGAILRLATNLILQATGRGSQVQYFDGYDKAVEWLLHSETPEQS